MEAKELVDRLVGLTKAMSAKGLIQPGACFSAYDGGTIEVFIHDGRNISNYFHKADTFEGCLAKAEAAIAALPDPAKEGERLFTRKLAEAIDIATEYSLPNAAILPVRAAIREVNAVLLAGPV